MANTSAIFKGSRTKLLTKDGMGLDAGQTIKVVDGAGVNNVPVSDAQGVLTVQSLPAAAVPNLDASKIASGTLDIARIPNAAMERLVYVADQPARYALTTATVQNGDSVYQNDTQTMYIVIDDTQLGNAAGYQVYMTNVQWANIQSKPVYVTQAATNVLDGYLTGADHATFSAKQPGDSDLTAIAALTGPGIAVKTSTDPAASTWANRTITGTANRLGVTNGDGVAANPTLNIDTTQFPSSIAADSGRALVSGGANTASWGIPAAVSDASMTGVVSWGGAGNYYSYTGGVFTILRPGVGRVNGTKITWAGGESVGGLAASKGYLISFTATNTLVATDISTLTSSIKATEFDNFDTYYKNNVCVFGIWTDGAFPKIVKEEHPYSYATDISVHDHFKFGQVFTFGGALLSVLNAANRTIQTSGEDMLDDHGLTTRIADQTGVALTCNAIFQNAGGVGQSLSRTGFTVSGITTAPVAGNVYSHNGSQYTILNTVLTGVSPNISGTLETWMSSGSTAPLASGNLTRVSGAGDITIAFSAAIMPTSITYTYAAAGVPTVLTSGGATRYGIVAIYVSKDDKQTPNTTTPLPTYFQVLSNTAYSSAANAANSIGSGASPDVSQFIMPSEMRAIELVLNGFVVIDGSSKAITPITTNGFVAGVKTVKASTSTGITGGSVTATTAVNVSTDTSNFNGLLSSVDTQVQQALDSIDDYMQYVAVSSNTTLVRNRVHLVNTSVARTLAFPALVPSHGSMVVVKDVTGSADVNPITITRSASETIDGVAASYVMSIPYGSVTFYSDGVNRWII